MNLIANSTKTAPRMIMALLLTAGLAAGLAACNSSSKTASTTPATSPAPAGLHDGSGPRDHRPTDYPPAAFSPKSPTTFKLSNGVPVMLWTKPELPLVAVRVLVRTGGPLDEPAQAGRTELAATMLGEGAGDLDATAFADTMQSLGAGFGSGAGTESATVSLTVLKRNLPKALGLMADAVERPRMEAEDWDRVKRLHLEDLAQEDDEPTIVAARVGARVLFSPSNPYAWPTEGTPTTVEKFTVDTIKACHTSLYTPEHAAILVSGDMTEAEAKSELEKTFGAWKGAQPPQVQAHKKSLLMPEPGTSLRVILVDRPEAVQTVIRFITPGYPMADAKRVPLRMLNTILGGSFTSRLNQNLREAHGYTYGVGSGFAMEPSTGYWTARASVVADKTGPSLHEFMSEFAKIRKGDITAGEVSKARESLKTDLVQRFEGINGVLGSAAELLEADLPFSTLGADAKAMDAVTADELNKLAPKVLPIETGVLILVGDKALILSQIKDLGLPEPVEYTVQGEPKAH